MGRSVFGPPKWPKMLSVYLKYFNNKKLNNNNSYHMKLKSLTLILALALGAQVAFAQQSKSDPSLEFNPHWYGQIQGGAGYTIGETAFKDLISPAGALSLGYQFNPTLGLRFNLAGYQGKGAVVAPLEVYKFNYLQGAFDLTLNLAQLLGYKHDRVFNPFVFIGGGAAYGFKNGANNITKTNPKEYFALLWEKNLITPVARVGIGADFRLSDAVALTLEVNDNVLSDKFNSKKVGSTSARPPVRAPSTSPSSPPRRLPPPLRRPASRPSAPRSSPPRRPPPRRPPPRRPSPTSSPPKRLPPRSSPPRCVR